MKQKSSTKIEKRRVGSNLLNGDLMGLAPLHADSGIQIVQLARAQGNGLKRKSCVDICSNKELFLFWPNTLFSCLSVFWISSFSSCSNSLRYRFNQHIHNRCMGLPLHYITDGCLGLPIHYNTTNDSRSHKNSLLNCFLLFIVFCPVTSILSRL